ncbi:MAG: peptidoglycan bridge formation glycyltransferase FemA/FemB family protein [Candidatus Pacebacteria bacterium]|nr:peptidoglycan bridge formation glycyltransferase FemA/FemB family protein [Candidatus Paceibacterota bacterium]
MKIIEIGENQKEDWNKFIVFNSSESFLQSWQWGEFQKVIGRKIFRIGVKDEDKLVAVALLIKHNLPFGKSYLYCPRGPVINITIVNSQISSVYDFLFVEIKKIVRKEKSIFLRIDPPISRWFHSPEGLWNPNARLLQTGFTALKGLWSQHKNYEHFTNLKKSPSEIQPKDTLILNLEKSEEDLLKEMKQKTRYNIRLAEKRGVQIRRYKSGDINQEEFRKKFEFFWELTKETSERNKIISHNKNYYQEMLKNLSFCGKTDSNCHSEFISESVRDDGLSNFQFAKQGMGNIKRNSGDTKKILNQVQNDSAYINNYNLIAKLYLAEYEEKIIAANIVLCFGDLTIYLHGASSNEHRNLMAPYLLQWKQIQDAKNARYKKYDFWGITIDGEKETWRGITKFKKGFGGEEKSYIGAYDLAIDKFGYDIYQVLKKVRRLGG